MLFKQSHSREARLATVSRLQWSEYLTIRTCLRINYQDRKEITLDELPELIGLIVSTLLLEDS